MTDAFLPAGELPAGQGSLAQDVAYLRQAVGLLAQLPGVQQILQGWPQPQHAPAAQQPDVWRTGSRPSSRGDTGAGSRSVQQAPEPVQTAAAVAATPPYASSGGATASDPCLDEDSRDPSSEALPSAMGDGESDAPDLAASPSGGSSNSGSEQSKGSGPVEGSASDDKAPAGPGTLDKQQAQPAQAEAVSPATSEASSSVPGLDSIQVPPAALAQYAGAGASTAQRPWLLALEEAAAVR